MFPFKKKTPRTLRLLWFSINALPLVIRTCFQYWIHGPPRPTWTLSLAIFLQLLRSLLQMPSNTMATKEGSEAMKEQAKQGVDTVRSTIQLLANKHSASVDREVRLFTPHLQQWLQSRSLVVEPKIRIRPFPLNLVLSDSSRVLSQPHPWIHSIYPEIEQWNTQEIIDENDKDAWTHCVWGEWVYYRTQDTPSSTTSPAHTGKVVLYFHGGAYMLMSPEVHRNIVARLSAELDRPVFNVHYRLAPEHPYPAALHDAIASYVHLLRQGIPAENILVMGDSAGGHLALTLVLWLRDHEQLLEQLVQDDLQVLQEAGVNETPDDNKERNESHAIQKENSDESNQMKQTKGKEKEATKGSGSLSKPEAVVLFSPWGDVTMSLPSVSINHENDYLRLPEDMELVHAIVLGWTLFDLHPRWSDPKGAAERDELDQWIRAHPYLCPSLAGDLSTNLPPILAFTGGAELILSDSIALHLRSAHAEWDAAKLDQELESYTRMLANPTPALCSDHEVLDPYVRLIDGSSASESSISVEVYRDMFHVFSSFHFVKESKYSLDRMKEWLVAVQENGGRNPRSGLFWVDIHSDAQKS